MVLSAILMVVLAAGQSKSLLNEVIPNPTGANAYEDYLRACDVVRTNQISKIVDFSPASVKKIIRNFEAASDGGQSTDSGESTVPSRELYDLAKQFKDSNQLQIWREIYRRGKSALDYLSLGNRKAFQNPRSRFTMDTTFPEYSQMRVLAKVSAAGAYVSFADGRSDLGTQYLLDSLELGHRVSKGPFISRLVGISIQNVALASYEKLLPSLSLRDALRFQERVAVWVPTVPVALDTVEVEFNYLDGELDGIFDRINDGYGQLFSEDPATVSAKSAAETMKKLSPADKKKTVQVCRALLDRHHKQVETQFSKPESEWDAPANEENSYPSEREVRTPEDLGEYFSAMTFPNYTQLGASEIRNRTQFRLMALSAAIVKFRWENDRLPGSLAELASDWLTRDPVGGDVFMYEPQGSGFRIWSKGTPRSGEIAFRYVLPIGGSSTPPPPFEHH